LTGINGTTGANGGWNKRCYRSKGDTGINGIDGIKQYTLDLMERRALDKWCWE
jgi:hypothetical protein